MSKQIQNPVVPRTQSNRPGPLQHSASIATLPRQLDSLDLQISQNSDIVPPVPDRMNYISDVEAGYTQRQSMGETQSESISCLKKYFLNTKAMKWITSFFTALYMGYILGILVDVDVIESNAMVAISAVIATTIVFMHLLYLQRPIWDNRKDIKSELANINWLDIGIYLSTIIFVITELNIYQRMADGQKRDLISSFNIIIAFFLVSFLIIARQLHYHNVASSAE